MRDFTDSGNAWRSRRLDPIQRSGLGDGSMTIQQAQYSEFPILINTVAKATGLCGAKGGVAMLPARLAFSPSAGAFCRRASGPRTLADEPQGVRGALRDINFVNPLIRQHYRPLTYQDGVLAGIISASRNFRKMRNMRISWADLQKQFGTGADKALTEPVIITRNGRDRLVLMSVEEYERLKRRDRRVVRLEDFTDEEMARIAAADVPAEQAYLDAELKDWQP